MATLTQTREAMVDLGQRVVRAGLVVAAGGNIAARLPGATERLLVTPQGWGLDELDPDMLVVVGADDTADSRGGRAPRAFRPTSELALHRAALRARADAAVSLHLHPPMATVLHSIGIPIRTITTDHSFYVRRLAVAPYQHPGTEDLAEAVAAAVATADIIVLPHHGCLVVADDFDLAFSRAANLEAAAIATYWARLLGDETTSCPEGFLEHVAAQEAQGIRYGR
jgi:ribulose-5-phosphate 4-epimerase/fuculose-1-phosphate aldolase